MKEDLKSKRTEFQFKKALYELIQKESFEKINVTDICEKAMYQRATFYTYYNSKEDLLESVIDELFEKIFTSIDIDKFLKAKDVFLEILNRVLDYFEEIKNDLHNMVLHNNTEEIRNYFLNYSTGAVNFIFAKLKNKPDFRIPKDMLVDFYVGGIVNMTINSIKNNHNYKKEEFLSVCEVMLNEDNYVKSEQK